MQKRKKLLIKLLVAVAAVVILAFLREDLQQQETAIEKDDSSYASPVADDHRLLQEFPKRYPERTVLLACAEDISDDGKEDLVVISQWGKDIETIALYTAEDGSLLETPPIPAPRENQRIRFFNMDKAGIMEVLITGEKNGQVGYAIYRIMHGELINLFGEGMEDCC